MPSNSEIRTLHFAQGVDVTLPEGSVADSATVNLENDAAGEDLGIQLDLNVDKEMIIDYTILRRTDTTTGLIERGRMRITSNPDGSPGVDKWLLSWDFKNDEGTPPGVTFLISEAGDDAFLLYDTTDLAGADHSCKFAYSTTRLFF